MRRAVLAVLALLSGLCVVAGPAHAATPLRVLFDDTKAEEAGNADWIISTAKPDPTVQDPSPSVESDWTGALSAWGVALQKTGDYRLATLASGPITSSVLAGYDVLVLPEPNILFTSAEKAAILAFVQGGGGLFMISDHKGSDRNNDGVDSIGVLNDLMGTGDPFGFAIDVGDIASDNPDVIGAAAAGDPIIDGPFGQVTGTIIRDGTTATLHPADNANVRGEVFRTGASASGTTGAAFVTSQYGSGRVAFWGDSSAIDDGTGQSGNTLYDGWDDPAGTDAAIALNATAWLGGGTSTGGSPTALADGGFESGTAPWALSGAIVVTSQAHGGTHSLHLGSSASTTDTASQSFTVPASGTLAWWVRMTTTDTSGTAHDVLSVKIGSTTVKTFSNAGTTATWQSSSASLAAYAGQTVTLTFSAVNDASSPSTFWVDDVSA